VAALVGQGFTIGAHSHDHPLYSAIQLAEQLEQTRRSVELLDSRFGLSPKAFAFPHADNGVGAAFFQAVFSRRLLDVTFGTAGLVSHFHPRNIERLSMEKTAAPASHILARHFTRAAYYKLRPH
jgi:peptidoglycan/xylan/chitin deacetylase (PgdA/CDA1 family)